jgi:hypothetical protein
MHCFVFVLGGETPEKSIQTMAQTLSVLQRDKRMDPGMDHEELSAAVKPMGTTWHFNPPEASHRGGVFESLIRPCRRILEAISSDFTVPSREVMVTLLTEVERVMNNRPLCKVSSRLLRSG